MPVRYVRFQDGRNRRWGIKEPGGIVPLSGPPWGRFRPIGEPLSASAVRILAPYTGGKIVCVGLNYGRHATESGSAVPDEPVLFMKPGTAVIGPGGQIVLPPGCSRVDHEAELAVVIGRRCRGVGAAQALDHVLGYTCANDVSARDFQRRDGQWTRAKGFDTFAPLGPAIVAGIDPGALRIECHVNGGTRQSSRTSDMVFGVAHLVAFISGIMTLLPGDVILTGTPEGVSPLRAGDRVTVSIEGIGELVNQVR